MQVEKVAIESLSFDPSNARKHDSKNIEAIKGSLRKFGQRHPIVVRNNVVLAGNGRLQAARELGWSEIEVVRADDMSATEAVAFSLSDNRSAEMATWDDDILGKQLHALFEDGWVLDDFGFEMPNVGEADLPNIADADEPECQQMTFTMHRDQVSEVTEILSRVKKEVKPEYPGNENSNGNALFYIVSKYNG